jgi:hypothetical protein
MKKILLLLVSGLLIACMAGSAMAIELEIWKDGAEAPEVLEIAPQSANYYDLRVIGGLGDAVTYSAYGVKIKLAGTSNYVPAQPDQVAVAFVRPGFTTPVSDSGNNNLDSGVLEITLGDIPIGSNIVFNVQIDDDVVPIHATASRRITAVPEFPTVALPVAAILGLVFIFGRKKEEM